MAKQYLVPTLGIINDPEDGTEYLIPTLGILNALPAPAAGDTITAPLIASTTTVYSPQINGQIVAPQITSASALFSPQINGKISTPQITAGSTLFALTVNAVVPAGTIDVPLIASTAQIFDKPGVYRRSYTELYTVGTSTGVTLSNGNLTVSTSGFSGTTRAILSGKGFSSAGESIGKWFWSYTIDSTSAITSVIHVGFGQNAIDQDGVSFSNTGSYRLNGLVDSNLGITYTTGDIVDIAVNFDAKLVWFRVNGGNWNGNASANPATGVGGKSFSSVSVTSDFKPGITFSQNSGTISTLHQVTANFGGSIAYTYAEPTDFIAWNDDYIIAPQIASSLSIYEPIVNNKAIVVPEIVSTLALYAPQIIGRISSPRIESTIVVDTPTLLAKITAPEIASTFAAYAPKLNGQIVSPRIASTLSLFLPSVQDFVGQNILVPLLTNSHSLFDPAIFDLLSIPQITSGNQLFDPKLNGNIIVPQLASSLTFYNAKFNGQIKLSNLLQLSPSIFAPRVFNPNLIVIPRIDSNLVFYPPVLARIVDAVANIDPLFPRNFQGDIDPVVIKWLEDNLSWIKKALQDLS